MGELGKNFAVKFMLESGPVSLIDAAGKQVAVPPGLASGFLAVADAAVAGEEVVVGVHNRLLTTQEAADQLGISRPTVIDWMDRGVLKATRTSPRGHRRVLLKDVQRLRRELSDWM